MVETSPGAGSSARKRAGTSGTAPPGKKARTRANPEFDSLTDQLGPRLRTEFAQLQRSEARIVRELSKPEVAAAFVADPVGTLVRIGVEVPPIIKQRLKATRVDGDEGGFARARTFQLPNGQAVTARINIRFTGAQKPG